MASCSGFSFLVSANESLQTDLRQTLLSTLGLNVTSSLTDTDSSLANVFCSAPDSALHCSGICPNADLAGVGVRTAFWISSILQAVLVAISPEDSAQGAWSAALLTASITISAFSQKRQHQLSIYHSTLVLNFSTFSSLVSLAVAPMCTVWREGTDDEDEDDTLRPEAEVEIALFGEEGEPVVGTAAPLSNLPRRKSHRQRLILSLILFTQVALQWTWVVMLFTDPEYTQKACVPHTVVIFFGKPFTARSINHDLFFVWPLWLLFHLLVTLTWGSLLVWNSSAAVHPVLSRVASRHESTKVSTVLGACRPFFPIDSGRMMVLFGNVMAFLLAVLLLVSSEVQVSLNCVLGGENTSWSFGQIAALLVSLAPAWSIIAALDRKKHGRCTYDVVASTSSPELTSRNLSPYAPTDGTQTPVNDSQSPDDISGPTQFIDAQHLAAPEFIDFRQRTRRSSYFGDSP